MDIKRFYFCGVLLSVLWVCGCSVEEEVDFVERLRGAETVQLDLRFGYFIGRSSESIASEVALNGHDGVYIMVLDERGLDKGLIDEFHKRGVAVGAVYMAACSYNPEDVFPEGWQAWQMESTGGVGVRHLSFVHAGYREWMKKRIVKGFGDFGFDGFTFAEPYYPMYNGTPEPGQFMDVSPNFQKAFKEATGNEFFPNFTDAADPHYYKTDRELYQDWVDFRVDAIVEFYDEVVNGEGGLREQFPKVLICTWTVQADKPNGLELLREIDGQDPEELVRVVRPDVHFVQTHWPDWSRGDLPADYAKNYEPYFEAARRADPQVGIGVQADVGSNAEMRKSRKWYNDFVKACAAAGVDTTTYYQFCLRGELYEEAPALKKVRLSGPETIKLCFDQRIGPESAGVMEGRVLEEAGGGGKFEILGAEVDGNILIATLDRPVKVGMVLKVPVGGVDDMPSVRSATSHVDPKPYGPVNKIAEGAVVAMEIDADYD